MQMSAAGRRRPWRVALPLLVFVVIAAGWSGFWFYAAQKAQHTLAAWRAREAQAGRTYQCGEQAISGYPFRFELQCDSPRIDLASNQPPVTITAAKFHIAAQIYDPTLLLAEFAGPVTIAIAGAPPARANWSLAQMSLRGLPDSPERLSVVLDDLTVDQAPAMQPLLRAKRVELHARLEAGTVRNNPIVRVATQWSGAMAPGLHPLLQEPFDLSTDAVLQGLDNLRPLPLPARLRQLQAANGKLQILRSRIQQGQLIAASTGELGLTGAGRLDGALQLTAVGLDKVLSSLGLDQLLPAPSAKRVAPAISALDRIIPGLGQIVRDNAGLGAAAGLAMIGKPAELEGQKAVMVPLRFVDGAVFLGPVRVGEVAPVF